MTETSTATADASAACPQRGAQHPTTNPPALWTVELVAAGTLPCIRIGAALRFEPTTIRAWLRGEKTTKAVNLPGLQRMTAKGGH